VLGTTGKYEGAATTPRLVKFSVNFRNLPR
jgi:hypothetical protein